MFDKILLSFGLNSYSFKAQSRKFGSIMINKIYLESKGKLSNKPIKSDLLILRSLQIPRKLQNQQREMSCAFHLILPMATSYITKPGSDLVTTWVYSSIPLITDIYSCILFCLFFCLSDIYLNIFWNSILIYLWCFRVYIFVQIFFQCTLDSILYIHNFIQSTGIDI